MRHGFTEGLAKRLEHQNPSAHLICEAVVTTAASIKETKDDWDGADSLTGMTSLDDGGVKITGSVTTHVTNPTQTTYLTDLDNTAPWEVAEVVWDQTSEIQHRELNLLVAELVNRRDGGDDGEVTFWLARLYRVARIRFEGGDNETKVYELQQLGSQKVAAGSYSTSAADVTFDFGLNGRAPVVGAPPDIAEEDADQLGSKRGAPRTIVRIDALKGEGVAAGNVGWRVDGANQSVASGSDSINRLTLEGVSTQASEQGFGSFTVSATPNGVPKFSLRAELFSQKTVAFTGASNDFDLGSAPGGSTKIRIIALGQEFSDSALTYQIDPGSGFVTVVDSDIIGEDNTGTGGTDLSGMARQQSYDARVILDPSSNTEVTPIVRRFGIEEITTENLDDNIIIGDATWLLDPIDLIGNTPELQLTLLRDGLRDYRDQATELLSDNYIKDLEFRIWVGHIDLDRKDWLHIDDFVIDKQETGGVGIVLTCVSPIALAYTTIPPKSGSSRSPLTYTAQTLKAVYADILTTQVNSFPTRRIGAMIESSTQVTKTITAATKGKVELDRVAYLAGGGLIASQGKLKFVDLMTDDSPVVATFGSEDIKMMSVSPGWEERIPDVYVGHGYTLAANDFAAESYASVDNAITNLGRATLDRKEELATEIAQWIPSSTLADTIASRITENFATGLILFTFESVDPAPWLEPGDSVLVETDRFVARDPHTGLAARGRVWARARIVACRNTLGTKFTVWVRSFADIIPTTTAISRDGFVQPLRPEIIVKSVRSSGTETVTLDIEDPSLRVTAIEYKKRDGIEGGDTLDASWQSSWDSSTGTVGTDTTLQRVIAVPVDAGLEGEIQWRVQYVDKAGDTQDVGDSFKVVNLEATTGSVTVPWNTMATIVESSGQGERHLASGYLTPETVTTITWHMGDVLLPPGVTVTDIEMYGYRDDGDDTCFLTFEKNAKIGTGTATTIATLTHSTTGWQTKAASISELVDEDNVYFIALQMRVDAGAKGDARYRGFKATYNRPAYRYSY